MSPLPTPSRSTVPSAEMNTAKKTTKSTTAEMNTVEESIVEMNTAEKPKARLLDAKSLRDLAFGGASFVAPLPSEYKNFNKKYDDDGEPLASPATAAKRLRLRKKQADKNMTYCVKKDGKKKEKDHKKNKNKKNKVLEKIKLATPAASGLEPLVTLIEWLRSTCISPQRIKH